MNQEEKTKSIIQKEIAKIIEKFDFESLITISKVALNDNKTKANIFLSIFPFENIEQVVEEVKKQKYRIQKEFNKLDLKTKPKLNFFIDPQAEQIDALKKLSI